MSKSLHRPANTHAHAVQHCLKPHFDLLLRRLRKSFLRRAHFFACLSGGNVARIGKPNNMKHFSLIRHLALACGVAAISLLPSCSSGRAPQTVASEFQKACNATVFSYNDTHSPKVRNCTEAGPLPAETARAMEMWLRQSTVKEFSYVYPQYYIAMYQPGSRTQRVWALCSDGQGNLVGILAPSNGVAAWDLPYRGAYRLYVCEGKNRQAIGSAIMETLADAGYDQARLNARRSRGLLEDRYLVSKPAEDTSLAHEQKLREQEEASVKAAEERKQAAAQAALEEQNSAMDEEEDADMSSSSSSDDEDSGDLDSLDDSEDEL